ncbi:Probable aminopeptidase NPEPL1, partial [Eumeta japonica]
MSSASVTLKFRWGLTPSDPEQQPVLVVGQTSHLNAISWADIRNKLEPRVTEEVWQRGLNCVTSAPGDSCELWPRGAVVASLPARRSRHSTPARAHALAKLVRSNQRGSDEFIVLVCRKSDVYASCVAIARSFPLYSARTAGAPLAANISPPAPTPTPRSVCVEILLANTQEGEIEEGVGELDPYLLEPTLSDEDLATITNAADAVRLAARITDTPCNHMNVDHFIEEACRVAKELDISPPTIIRGEELKSRGMGGIYGVGRAAAVPPALVALSWTPPNASSAAGVAWVGKGIVYDTGGLSIKARTSMVGMKGDCGGAAAVLAAFAAAVRARPLVALHAVLCLAENAVGPDATRPDDIHQLYSGRTVEINNTDAEGRLVLSDGVVYAARDLKATSIIDVATLTGAQ